MSTLDRIAEIQKSALLLRLQKGAEILGRLWREGLRCSNWSAVCMCGAGASELCKAKLKWFGLFQEVHDGCDFSASFVDPWFLVEVMIVDGYFDATGLTAAVQMSGAHRPIKVGPKGTTPDTIFDLASVPDGVERFSAIRAVLAIQGAGL